MESDIPVEAELIECGTMLVALKRKFNSIRQMSQQLSLSIQLVRSRVRRTTNCQLLDLQPRRQHEIYLHGHHLVCEPFTRSAVQLWPLQVNSRFKPTSRMRAFGNNSSFERRARVLR